MVTKCNWCNWQKCKDKDTNILVSSFSSPKNDFLCSSQMFGDLPYLSIRWWSLSDDRAGLRRGQGLLDHNTGIVVAHPWVGLLVLALTCLAVQWDVLQRRSKQVYEVRYLWVSHSSLKVAQLKHYNCLALGSAQPACVGNEELCKLSSTDIQSTYNLHISPQVE